MSSPRKSPTTRQTIVAGFICVIVGVVMLLLPWLLGPWEYNKYIVVVGLLATMLGLGFLLNGALDAMRSSR